MAATSHDFWLKNLTPAVWKSLHMLVYLAYALVVMHVALGALQAERSPLYSWLLGAGAVGVVTLHLIAGWREHSRDMKLRGTRRSALGQNRGSMQARWRAFAKGGVGWSVCAVESVLRCSSTRKRSRPSAMCARTRMVRSVRAGSLTAALLARGTAGSIARRMVSPRRHSLRRFRPIICALQMATCGPPRALAGGDPGRACHHRGVCPCLIINPLPVHISDNSDFFVGYLPTPAGARHLLLWFSVFACLALVVVSGILAAGQRDPGTGRWETAVSRTFDGLLISKPYPVLRMFDPAHPNIKRTFLLVSEGKFGVESRARKWESRTSPRDRNDPRTATAVRCWN
jgi:hypothetical protein